MTSVPQTKAPAKTTKAPTARAKKTAPAIVTAPKTATAKVEAAPKVVMTYYRNGRPFSPGEQNQLHQVAWYLTKDVEPGKPRISSKALIELLAKLGITDPKTTEWDVTLPNGQTASARFAVDSKLPEPVVPVAPVAPVAEVAKP